MKWTLKNKLISAVVICSMCIALMFFGFGISPAMLIGIMGYALVMAVVEFVTKKSTPGKASG